MAESEVRIQKAPAFSGKAFWAGKKGRSLLWLTAGTVLLVLAAIVVVTRDVSTNAVRFAPQAVFPGFEAKQPAAESLTIADKDHAVHIKKNRHGVWVVSEVHEYAASQEKLREFFLGLTELTAIERKTARPDWQAGLGLVAPTDGGDATSVIVADKAGQSLAGLLVGRLQLGGANGKETLFVRKIGEAQAYLAEGDLALETSAAEWVDPGIVDLARDRVRRVAVAPASGPAYTITRPTPQDVNFALEKLPPGREMMSETAANGLGAGAIAVTLEDVRPAGDVDFTAPSRIVYETFDGLSIALDVTKHGDVSWLRASATAVPSAEKTVSPADGAKAQSPAVAEAAAINARTQGWAYAIADWKASLFTKPLESLLKTVPPPETKAAPAQKAPAAKATQSKKKKSR